MIPEKKPPVIIQIFDGDEPQTVGDPGETENSSGLDGGSAAVEGTPPLKTDNITLNVAGEAAHSQQGVTDKLETAEVQAKKIPKQVQSHKGHRKNLQGIRRLHHLQVWRPRRQRMSGKLLR